MRSSYELISELKNPGFESRGEKGTKVTVSGRTGDDAKPHQIKDVKSVIDEVSK